MNRRRQISLDELGDVPAPEAVSETDASRLRREIWWRLAELVVKGSRGPDHAGRRFAVFAWIAARGALPWKTQRQLARWLGISAPRVKQLLNAAERELASLYGSGDDTP